MSWMYYNETFSHGKLYENFGKFVFLVRTTVKFRKLQISKILVTNTNRIFPILFKVMYISLRYTQFEKQFHND